MLRVNSANAPFQWTFSKWAAFLVTGVPNFINIPKGTIAGYDLDCNATHKSSH